MILSVTEDFRTRRSPSPSTTPAGDPASASRSHPGCTGTGTYASDPWQPAVLTSPNRLNVRNGSVAGSYPASPARSIHLGHRRPRGTRPEPHPRRPARPQAGTACRIAAPSPATRHGNRPGSGAMGRRGRQPPVSSLASSASTSTVMTPRFSSHFGCCRMSCCRSRVLVTLSCGGDHRRCFIGMAGVLRRS